MSEVAILPGWEFRDGIWNGPFPYDGFDTTRRMCASCGAILLECMGCVKAGDVLPALQGKPLSRFPRELCFVCAVYRRYWNEDGKLVSVKGITQ